MAGGTLRCAGRRKGARAWPCSGCPQAMQLHSQGARAGLALSQATPPLAWRRNAACACMCAPELVSTPRARASDTPAEHARPTPEQPPADERHAAAACAVGKAAAWHHRRPGSACTALQPTCRTHGGRGGAGGAHQGEPTTPPSLLITPLPPRASAANAQGPQRGHLLHKRAVEQEQASAARGGSSRDARGSPLNPRPGSGRARPPPQHGGGPAAALHALPAAGRAGTAR